MKHLIGEYLRDMAHTKGIESFWALLKRGHYGIYHHINAKHLHRYVKEFSFPHNTAQLGTMPIHQCDHCTYGWRASDLPETD